MPKIDRDARESAVVLRSQYSASLDEHRMDLQFSQQMIARQKPLHSANDAFHTGVDIVENCVMSTRARLVALSKTLLRIPRS